MTEKCCIPFILIFFQIFTVFIVKRLTVIECSNIEDIANMRMYIG